jgi:V/A-type H+-transporting ATPase subunit C
MSGFDYANARLRALKSRLLSRRELEALAGAGSTRGLLLALSETTYRAAVQAVLAQAPPGEAEADRLAEALRLDLLDTLGRVRRFFQPYPDASQLAALALRRLDVHNLKTILRGLLRQVPTAEILASTMPAGDLNPVELSQLAHAPHVSEALDLLATWRFPLARPLLEWRAAPAQANGDLAQLELALERWHLRSAREAAEAAGADAAALVHALRREADAANITTALRLASLAERPSPAADVLVDPGQVPLAVIQAAAAQSTILGAVHALEATPYGPALRTALPEYEHSRHLSVFEHALTRLEQRLRVRHAIEDALGIGVLLAYLALKTNEVADLRAIAYGIALGEPPEAMRAALLAPA